MTKYIVLPMENGRRQYINTAQVRSVHDQRDEDSVVVVFDEEHKEYLSRDRAAPLLKWLKQNALADSDG